MFAPQALGPQHSYTLVDHGVRVVVAIVTTLLKKKKNDGKKKKEKQRKKLWCGHAATCQDFPSPGSSPGEDKKTCFHGRGNILLYFSTWFLVQGSRASFETSPTDPSHITRGSNFQL